MGGRVRAQSGIAAAVLGSAACVRTCLELELPSERVEALSAIKAKIDKKKEDLAGLQGLSTQCGATAGAADNETCRKIGNTVDAVRNELNILKQQRDSAILEIAELKKGRIRALRRVFPGVQVRLFGIVRNIEKDLGPGEFFLKGDEVEFEPR
jgi:uncharacterized protein (DUF342 family)